MQQELSEYDSSMKICLVGGKCGKSVLLERFAGDGKFNENMSTTIGLDLKIKTLCVSGGNVKLVIHDTSSQERFRDITSNPIRQADAVFVCYDTNEDSISSRVRVGDRIAEVKMEAQQTKYNVQIYVVGLKSDLPPSKEMEAYVRAMLEQHKLEAWRWITVSSKTGERVEIPFYAAAVQHVKATPIRGRLQIKTRGALFGSSWAKVDCTYNPATHEFSSTDSKGKQKRVTDCWVVDVPNAGKEQHRFDIESMPNPLLPGTHSTIVALAAAGGAGKQRWLAVVETKQAMERRLKREAEERSVSDQVARVDKGLAKLVESSLAGQAALSHTVAEGNREDKDGIDMTSYLLQTLGIEPARSLRAPILSYTSDQGPPLQARVAEERVAAEERRKKGGRKPWSRHNNRQALEQAQQSRRMLVEGLANDRYGLMGVYEVMEGKMVNKRAVWQKEGGGNERFLYFSADSSWIVSTKKEMEKGGSSGWMHLSSAALTPDQARPDEVWVRHAVRSEPGVRISNKSSAQFVASPEVQVRRQQSVPLLRAWDSRVGSTADRLL
jgi:small GTP-binding protein